MPSQMDATVVTVGELFSDEFRLELPYFQRGYAWRIEQVAQLLDHLRQAMRGDWGLDWYPLGVIILAKQATDARAEVTDGHQRLITLTLLVAVLRDLETDDALRRRLQRHIVDAAGRWRLTTSATAQRVLAEAVQTDGATARLLDLDDEDRSDSEDSIIANRDWLRTSLADGASSADERRRLAAFVLEQCRLAVVAVEDDRAARLLFTTMHATGLRPDPSDLMKAEVLAAMNPDERPQRQAVWESHEANLGRDGIARLIADIDALATGRAAATAARPMTDRFGLGDPSGAVRFVDLMIKPLGDCLAEVLGAGRRVGVDDGGISRRMQYLAELVKSHESWRAPLILFLERHGTDSAITADFLRRLEPRAFVSQLTGEEPQRREARYRRLMDEIRNGSVLAGGRALEIAADERVEARRLLTIDRYLKRRNTVLLLRIDAAIEGDQIVTRRPRGTTEHVLPKNPATRSHWLQDFPASAATLRHALGNLTLLTEAEQLETRNRDWVDKRPILARSPFAISRRAAELDRWGPEEVRQRTDALARLLLASWGIADEA